MKKLIYLLFLIPAFAFGQGGTKFNIPGPYQNISAVPSPEGFWYFDYSTGTASVWADSATVKTKTKGKRHLGMSFYISGIGEYAFKWDTTYLQKIWGGSGGGGSGTVTSVSVVSANGFAGTVATSTTTPAATISTTVTGILKGNGTAISAVTSGTDIKTIASNSVLGSGNITVDQILPSQTSNSGKVLTTNGTNSSWQSTTGSTYFTSRAGAISDADLSLGSVTFGTDNTTILQSILNNATSTNPIIVYWDGAYSVTGLVVKSNTIIICGPGCGAILRNHSSKPLIINYNYMASNNATPIVQIDHDITFQYGSWNGNGYNTGTNGSDLFDVANGGSPTNGSAQYRYDQSGTFTGSASQVNVFNFFGIDNLVVSGLHIFGSRLYAVYHAYVTHVVEENLDINWGASSSRDQFNYDGLHYNSKSQYLTMRNIVLQNGNDDGIALNADDGYSPTLEGGITDVTIDNITFGTGSQYGISMRSTVSLLDRISINNIKGTTKNYLFNIDVAGFFITPGAGNIGTISISNVDVIVTGSQQAQYAYLFCTEHVKTLNISNWHRSDFSAWFDGTQNQYFSNIRVYAGGIIENLNIDGMTLQNESEYQFQKGIIILDEGGIDNLSISNTVFKNSATGNPVAPLVLLNGGSIQKLTMNNVYVKNAYNVVNLTGGSIGSISATNLTHDNFTGTTPTFTTAITVPDIVVSNYNGISLTGVSGSGAYTSMRGDGFISPISATPTYRIFDNFTRPNNSISIGSAPIGGAWINSGLTIASNLLTTASSTHIASINANTSFPDVYFTVPNAPSGGLGQMQIQICVEQTAASAGFNAITMDPYNGTCVSYINTVGTTYTGSGSAPSNGDTFRIVRTPSTNTVTVYKNGSSINSFTFSGTILGTGITFVISAGTSVDNLTVQ